MKTQASFVSKAHNPDVLSCIANLSSDEVFTPPSFANLMLDTLEATWRDTFNEELWQQASVRFLDPGSKSAVFLREITKRLIRGLEGEFADLTERVDHILTQQIYGIGTTSLTSLISRRTLYCTKDATGEHSVAPSLSKSRGNIQYSRMEHDWTKGRCAWCGANQLLWDRPSPLENHAYEFIHVDDIAQWTTQAFGAEMDFDVVIGNPPYQLTDGGNSASATPLYHKFVTQAINLSPRMLSMVIPSRWFSGGKGLSDFREAMLSDERITSLHDFPDTSDVFPEVNNRGGICYFTWSRDHSGPAHIVTYDGRDVVSESVRPLLEPGLDTFIRLSEGLEILRKVATRVRQDGEPDGSLAFESNFSSLVSSRKPFGLSTNFSGRQGQGVDDVLVYRNGGHCFASREEIPWGHELIDQVKLLVPYASPGSDEYPHLILSKPIISHPGEACTETYLLVGPFDSELEAMNVASYMATKFFRFMVNLLRVSHHVTKTVYRLVPLLDFNHQWNDEQLFEMFGITKEEQDFIDRFIKEVAWKGDYDRE